jgi:hypothetical protein
MMFRLEHAPSWTDVPSYKLTYTELMDDNQSRSVSVMFPVERLDDLIEILRNGPDHHPEVPGD